MFRIEYETLTMHDDEMIARFFLIVDEVFNIIKNTGDQIKDVIVVENIFRSLIAKFDSMSLP